MADYDVGYGKTPKHSRFQPGRSGNQKGRPRRASDPLAEVVQGILDAPAKYRENGRTKTASRDEVRLKVLLGRAVKGDIKAADELFEERKYALKQDGAGARRVLVTDWLEDFDGQMAAEKTGAGSGAVSDAPKAAGKHGGKGQATGHGRGQGEGV